jgi:hypothetical protein
VPPPAVVDAFVNAVNAGDTEAFLALFADRGIVDDWGTRYSGRQKIRVWSDRELIGVNATIEITSSEQHGQEASVLAQVGGRGFKGTSRFSFIMDGTLIKEMRITAA